MNGLRDSVRRLRILSWGLVLGEFPAQNMSSTFSMKFEDINPENYAFNCYMTWIKPKLPKSHAEDIAKFVDSNKGYNFFFFDDLAQAEWMNSHFAGEEILRIYHAMKFPAAKSGVFRYCLVYKLGGTYFSINRLTQLPLRALLGDLRDFKVSFSHVPFIRENEFPNYPAIYKNLSIIEYTVAAPPKHPVLENAINLIISKAPSYWNKRFEKVNRAIWEIAGPFLLTEALDQYLNKTGLLPKIYGFDFDDSLMIPRRVNFRYGQSPSYMSFSDQIVLGD